MTRRYSDFTRPHRHCTVGDVIAIVMAGLFLTVIAVCVFVVVLSHIRPAHADWKPEYSELPQEVQDWYSRAELTWAAQQRFPFKKCCDKTEAVKTKFRVTQAGGDAWEYQTPDGAWSEIPGDIIHWNESGPHGEAVLFRLPNGMLTCFFPPMSGN